MIEVSYLHIFVLEYVLTSHFMKILVEKSPPTYRYGYKHKTDIWANTVPFTLTSDVHILASYCVYILVPEYVLTFEFAFILRSKGPPNHFLCRTDFFSAEHVQVQFLRYVCLQYLIMYMNICYASPHMYFW